MKLKNKALIKITTALILLAITLSIPLMAYALTAASMTSSDVSGIGTTAGGPTKDRTGWLFYCIDPSKSVDEQQVTDTICCTNNWNLTDRNGNEIPNKFLITRYGKEVNWGKISTSTPWGYGAWKSAGNGKYVGTGTDLKEFLLDEYSSGITNAYHLVEYNFGSDMAAKFNSGKVYLVFEPIFGNAVFKNSKNTGYWTISTSFWWGQVNIAFDVPDSGDPWIKSISNDLFGHCVMLEDNEVTAATRFSPAATSSGNITNQELGLDQWNGYGIGIIRSDTEIQSTCDETQSNPHKPADESTGTYQIVKNYVSQMTAADGTITYNDEGYYTKVDSAAEISIEDESSNTGYTLMQWYATDSSDTSVTSVSNNSLVWDSNVPGTKTVGGTQEHTINLEDYGSSKTVYLLLMKSDAEEVEKEDGVNFTISESAVTRRVSFSEDEDGVTDLK